MGRPRGRPKNSDIEVLIIQGLKENSHSKLKCSHCNRIFARNKNLNAHIAAHKAEKNYVCNFPGCSDRFVQSSQLNIHKYKHSTEKPFICPADGCMERQRHSHRICIFHANLKLIKQPQTEEEIRFHFYSDAENLSEAQKIWFEKYMSEKENKQQTAFKRKRKIDDVEGLQGTHKDKKRRTAPKIREIDSEEDLQKNDEDKKKQTAPKKIREIDKVEDLQEIRKDSEKEIHQVDIQQQIEKKNPNCIEGAIIFFWFVNHLHEKAKKSKAVLKQSCI